MSSRDEKSKKSAKDAKSAEESSPTDNDEPVPEVILEKPVELRTIVITVNTLKNIVPLYPIADVKSNLTYLDRDLGETSVTPVMADGELSVGESFEIPIDINSPKQLDSIATNPVFLKVTQLSGTLDDQLYEQLQPTVQESQKPAEDVESLFSLYEAFNGEKPAVLVTDVKKPKKKGKSEKSSRDKSQTKSKSAISKSSKTSKKSKSSSATLKSDARKKSSTSAIKSEVYGMCAIDLIPLLYGKISYSETLHLRPPKQSCDTLSTFKNFPEVSITISIKENVKLADIKNILNFTVESICNVPSLMIADMDCKVCAMLPLQHNGSHPTAFYNPKLTSKAPNKEVPKRWPGIHDIGYNANTTKYLIDYSDFGDIINKSKLNVEEGFANDAVRLEYNYLKRNILFKDANLEFNAFVRLHRKLVLEIYATPKSKKQEKYDVFADENEESSANAKPKTSKSAPFLHLMAVLDLVKLIYPGITRVRIAAPVTTFTYDEASKFGLDDSFFMPKPRLDLTTGRTSKSKLDTGRKKKAEKKEKVGKKDKGSVAKEDKNLAGQLPPKPEEPVAPEPSVQVYNEDGKPCFIVVELELLYPIKPKREAEELTGDLQQLQFEALQTTKTVLNKSVTDDLYQQTINEIISDLTKQWSQYSELIISIPKPPYAHFIEYLQKVGAYQAYLNSITSSATLLISNKYKCEERDFKNSKEYQNLLSEVYTDMISAMHKVLNTLVCTGMKPLERQPKIPQDISLFYAKEAAELKLYDRADRYFLERIINDQNTNPILWFDYAIYNIEMNDAKKAFECAQEAIAMSNSNKYVLLLYGALLTEKDDIHDAEICFLNFLITESKWVEGWCVLYLFYQKCGRLDGMEVAMDFGKKEFDELIVDDYTDFEDLAWSKTSIPNTLFFRTAGLLIKMRLYSWAELALAEEVLVPKHYGYVHYLLAVINYYKGDFDHTLEHLEEAKDSLGADFAISALCGHTLLAQNRLKEAREEYYHVIESFDRPEDVYLVYVNCASVLRQLGDSQTARRFLLIACKYHQTPHLWYMAGQLYFEENDLLSAEECFNEANAKDNKYAEAWAYLTLINLKLNRLHEAEQCYQQAMKSQLPEESELNTSIVEEFKKAKNLA